MGEFELRGQKISGSYLAMLVAINPNLPVQESARTPQLIAELGALVAAASYEMEMAEVRYRQWRDSAILDLTRNLDFVKEEIDPDAKKPLTKTSADSAVRTLSDYPKFWDEKTRAAEVHAMLHAAYEAARARARAIYSYENFRGGGVTRTPDYDNNGESSHEYDAGTEETMTRAEVVAMEEAISQGDRSPIPSGSGSDEPPKKAKAPPPPPPPPSRSK